MRLFVLYSCLVWVLPSMSVKYVCERDKDRQIKTDRLRLANCFQIPIKIYNVIFYFSTQFKDFCGIMFCYLPDTYHMKLLSNKYRIHKYGDTIFDYFPKVKVMSFLNDVNVLYSV
jgi:hypothetical protein